MRPKAGDLSEPAWALIVAPGLEALAMEELDRLSARLGIDVGKPDASKGLIEFSSSDPRIPCLNDWLRLPTRLLLRVSRFRCRDFPKLFKKTSSLPWQRFLSHAGDGIRIEVSASRSRLNMKRRISSTVLQAISASIGKELGLHAPSDDSDDGGQTVYVRMQDDSCMLSVDSSGAPLYRRGIRKFIGKAPIRETLAAACLQHMLKTLAPSRPIELVDPMAGSGTFLLEAALHGCMAALPRDYAWEDWEGQWCRRGDACHDEKAKAASPFAAMLGYDADEEAVNAAKGNFSTLKKALGFQPAISLQAADSLTFTAPPPAGPARWLVTNPPYNLRLALHVPYENLVTVLLRNFAAEALGIILPSPHARGLLKAAASDPDHPWAVAGNLQFSNGGQSVEFLVVTIRP